VEVMSEYSEERIFSHLPENIRQKLQTAIKEARAELTPKFELEVLAAIKALLEEMDNSAEHGVDVSLMGAVELEQLMNELDTIAKKLEGNEEIPESDAVKLLLHIIRGRLTDRLKKKGLENAQEEEFSFQFMTKKQREQYNQHLREMVMYELYKFLTPHQIAGETRLENFVNNVVHGGINYALHYMGEDIDKAKQFSDMLGKSFVKELEKHHHDMHHDATGWANREEQHGRGGGFGR
jgi:hypothetical protein